MKVLITGASGMLGVDIVRELQSRAAKLVITSRYGNSGGVVAMDIRDWQSVKEIFDEHRPNLAVHLAAETDVDLCEKDPEHAYATNAFGTENIAVACREHDATMVYVSTANVFDGNKAQPYVEYDTPGSLNVYGNSKLAGERLVSMILDKYFIFRAGWMVGGWEIDKKFVYKIVQLCRSKKELKVVNDKFGSPTFTADFTNAMLHVIETQRYGLYHLVNQGFASRWEIACEIVRLLGKEGDIEVRPVSSSEFPLPAPRPRSEMMRSIKLDLLGLDTMPHWKGSLERYIAENKHKD